MNGERQGTSASTARHRAPESADWGHTVALGAAVAASYGRHAVPLDPASVLCLLPPVAPVAHPVSSADGDPADGAAPPEADPRPAGGLWARLPGLVLQPHLPSLAAACLPG